MAIAHLVFNVPVDSHFDYLIPENLIGRVLVGSRVQAVFARKKAVGVVVGLAESSAYDNLNVIIKILDLAPAVSLAMLDFARIFSGRNSCSLGEAVFLFLPSYLRKSSLLKSGIVAREAGQSEPSLSLIFDRTLSKRWEILLPLMRQELEAKRGVLVLVPETSYLDDVLPRLAELAVPKARVLLRQGTEKEEYQRWLNVRSGEAALAVGFLSAVFAPVQALGLIVVIDEESRFYKNDQSPFYNARDAAFLRAAREGASVVCVSSAPSVELWREVVEGRVRLQHIQSPLAGIGFLDISNFKMKKGNLLSPGLRLHLEGVLRAGGKALLYVPAAKGVGLVIEELNKFMPQAHAGGYDRSSSCLPEVDIIVATQAVLRYRGKVVFDFASVLDIDYEFHKADHRAAHSAFALVQYLRQMAKKTVLLQTREPQSPQLHAIAEDDHGNFYLGELAARQEMDFPPYGVFAALVLRSADPDLACAESKRLYDILNEAATVGLNVMEPQQDRTAILRGKFRWRVMLQSSDHCLMGKVCRDLAVKFRGKKDIILTVNIDP